MAIKEWTTQYPTGLDSVVQMPELENYGTVGNLPGDNIRFSQLGSVRDAIIQLEALTGSDNLESSSLRNQVINYNSTWSYLGITQPTGMTTAPTLLYQFDGTASALNDRSGNGMDLTSTSGSTLYKDYQGLTGIYLDGTYYLIHDSNAIFVYYGALTIEMQFILYTPGYSVVFTCYAYGNSDSSDTYNYLYRPYVNANGIIGYFAENDDGGIGHDLGGLANIYCPGFRIILLTMVRDAAGDIKYYLDGQYISSISSGGIPSGGTNASCKFGIGNEYDKPTAGQLYDNMQGMFFSCRFTKAEFSAAQVLESYNTLRGIT